MTHRQIFRKNKQKKSFSQANAAQIIIPPPERLPPPVRLSLYLYPRKRGEIKRKLIFKKQQKACLILFIIFAQFLARSAILVPCVPGAAPKAKGYLLTCV
jgi:hypothetical protein